jgi:FAD/FMN-containing dehydrogenase
VTIDLGAFRTTPSALHAISGLCEGAVYLPSDPGYDAARMAWNLAVDQRPAAVAYPVNAAEAAAVVRAAAAAGLRVAPQRTGHNARPLGPLDDVVLLRTSGMTGVTVDASARRVRVRAGALWLDAVEAAAAHGLNVLHGTSPDVGVVGYSLGGGIGWYARALGLQSNAITGAELVTASGEIVRTDSEREPELFWALRGGGGSFGIVTELEFRAFPYTSAYGGMLVWDLAYAEPVLRRWAEWAAEAPNEVTTSFRLLRMPRIPGVPQPFRGRRVVVVDGAVLAGDAEATKLLAPLRALDPDVDTFARAPAADLVRLHMDPEGPTARVSGTSMLSALPPQAADALLRSGGPGSASSLLMIELRQLGGALARPAAGPAALPSLDGQFLLFAATSAPTAQAGAQGLADARRLVDAMAPWATGRECLNFAEHRVDASAGYDPSVWARLSALRAQVDPRGLFVAGHEVPVHR